MEQQGIFAGQQRQDAAGAGHPSLDRIDVQLAEHDLRPGPDACSEAGGDLFGAGGGKDRIVGTRIECLGDAAVHIGENEQ